MSVANPFFVPPAFGFVPPLLGFAVAQPSLPLLCRDIRNHYPIPKKLA